MKILKGILVVILAIIALFFIVAIFLPDSFRVQRSTEINKPVNEVYNYVADFNNFHDWNPWTKLEPDHKVEITGDSATIGQKYYWEGKIIGSGDMVFTEFNPYSKIKSDIHFYTPNEGEAKVDWDFEPFDKGTKVTWSIYGDSDYPFGRYMGLMMDGFLGASFEEGMKNLKEKFDSNN